MATDCNGAKVPVGAVVQIVDESHHWFPCLVIVSEPKPWGIQGYVTVPTNGEEANGNAYIRLQSHVYELIGQARIRVASGD